MRTRLLGLILCGLAVPSLSAAQQPYNLAVEVDHLASIFTRLYGPNGLVVDSTTALAGGQSHSAHFTSGFESEFSQFGTALTSQIVSLPLPSPASGFTYEFDPQLGVFSRTTSSFGPILAERAETIGAKRVSVGFAFQSLTFDTIEGVDLSLVPAVFTHEHAELLGGREDVVTTVNSISAKVQRFTGFLTYGVTNRLDVSVALPVVSNDLRVVSDATIQRIGTQVPEIHFFRATDDSVGNRRIFTAFGSAAGLGDIAVRLKQTVTRTPTVGFAVALDLRLPTGNEEDLLGTGAAGVQPFAIWSATYGPFSPHANAGYQWNGSSTLAGTPGAGESRDLPDVAIYTVGTDLAVNGRLTVAFDLLGRYVIDSPRMRRDVFHALDGRSVFPSITFTQESFNELSGAAGFKLNVAGQVLIDLNVLFRLNDAGLRDKIAPLVGIEYTF